MWLHFAKSDPSSYKLSFQAKAKAKPRAKAKGKPEPKKEVKAQEADVVNSPVVFWGREDHPTISFISKANIGCSLEYQGFDPQGIQIL